MKYNTRKQRKLSLRKIVKRKNKKTRKQRNLSFRQIVERKNKKTRTRKQQHGGFTTEIYILMGVGLTCCFLYCCYKVIVAINEFIEDISREIREAEERRDVERRYQRAAEIRNERRQQVVAQSGGEPASEEVAAEKEVDIVTHAISEGILKSNVNQTIKTQVIKEQEIKNVTNFSDDVSDRKLVRINRYIGFLKLFNCIMSFSIRKFNLQMLFAIVYREFPEVIASSEAFVILISIYSTKADKDTQLALLYDFYSKHMGGKCEIRPEVEEEFSVIMSNINKQHQSSTLKMIKSLFASEQLAQKPKKSRRGMFSSLPRIRMPNLPNFLQYRRTHHRPAPQITPKTVALLVDNPIEAEKAFAVLSDALDTNLDTDELDTNNVDAPDALVNPS